LKLNQDKFVKVFEVLAAHGVDAEEAASLAARASKKAPIVASKIFDKGKLTVEPSVTTRQLFIAYAEKQNGREFSLQAAAAAINRDVNSVSAVITKVLASGNKLSRTGFGKYVYRKNG